MGCIMPNVAFTSASFHPGGGCLPTARPVEPQAQRHVPGDEAVLKQLRATLLLTAEHAASAGRYPIRGGSAMRRRRPLTAALLAAGLGVGLAGGAVAAPRAALAAPRAALAAPPTSGVSPMAVWYTWGFYYALYECEG